MGKGQQYEMTLGMVVQIFTATVFIVVSLLGALMCITQANYFLHKRRLRTSMFPQNNGSLIIGFFHPFCDAGAGGEKVLWQAVSALQQSKKLPKQNKIVIYSGSSQGANDILSHVKVRFGIDIRPDNLIFAKLTKQEGLKPENYKSFTMLWQAYGSIIACCEAMQIMPCDIWIDTMGVGYAYPFVKLLYGPKLISYTHYPLVSFEMLKVVVLGLQQYNNREEITKSKVKSFVKKIYYLIMTLFYSFCGHFIDQVATNSSWTHQHILQIWNKPSRTQIIYPPCDTTDYMKNISLQEPRENILVSFAQFRHEKDHSLQLKIWKKALKSIPDDSKLIMVGTCRDREDYKLLDQLKLEAQDLGISHSVEFAVNKSKADLLSIFSQAKAAIHTMKFEHFGIAIVELMASGIITIAHNSGGPKYDIIGNKEEPIGYLADDQEEYTMFVVKAINEFYSPYHQAMRKTAREWVVEQFGNESFNKLFERMIQRVL